jgi:hypothetical protein
VYQAGKKETKAIFYGVFLTVDSTVFTRPCWLTAMDGGGPGLWSFLARTAPAVDAFVSLSPGMDGVFLTYYLQLV